MCGFSDVRKDEDGYYCGVCGLRMPEEYEQMVKETLPPKFLKELLQQCSPEKTGAGNG